MCSWLNNGFNNGELNFNGVLGLWASDRVLKARTMTCWGNDCRPTKYYELRKLNGTRSSCAEKRVKMIYFIASLIVKAMTVQLYYVDSLETDAAICRFPWRYENSPSALLLSFIFSSLATRVYVFLHSAPPLDKKLKFMHRLCTLSITRRTQFLACGLPRPKTLSIIFILLHFNPPTLHHIFCFSHTRVSVVWLSAAYTLVSGSPLFQ